MNQRPVFRTPPLHAETATFMTIPPSLRFAVTCLGLATGWACGRSTSPTTPTSVSPTPSSLSGYVEDTAFGGLVGARVEIIEGAQPGIATVSGAYGRFMLSGVLRDGVRVSASKQGYVTVINEIQIPRSTDVVWQLESTEASADLAGEYSLTLIADATCAGLPDLARKRTYVVALTRDSRSPFQYAGTLGAATPYRSSNAQVVFGVSGSTVRFEIGEYEFGFVEDLGSATVEIEGAGETVAHGPSSAGSFRGAFTYCDGRPQTNWNTDSSCPVRPVYCEASSHQFTLTRQ